MNSHGAVMAQAATERLDVDQAAAYLGLSSSTLNSWRSAGKGPRYVRIGNRVKYRRGDLDEYEKSRIVETTDSRAAA